MEKRIGEIGHQPKGEERADHVFESHGGDPLLEPLAAHCVQPAENEERDGDGKE